MKLTKEQKKLIRKEGKKFAKELVWKLKQLKLKGKSFWDAYTIMAYDNATKFANKILRENMSTEEYIEEFNRERRKKGKSEVGKEYKRLKKMLKEN